MPLVKLNRINNGGAIYINSDLIRFIEIDTGSTTVNMGPGNVYAVMESPEHIAQKVEEMEMMRIRDGIQASDLGQKKTEII